MKLPKDKRALVISILFHIVVLIVFLFVGLVQPDPIPEEIGVEIAMADFGDSFTGSGNNPSPQVNNNPTPSPQPVAQPTSTPTNAPTASKVVEETESDIATPSSKQPAEKPVEKPAEKPVEKVEEKPKQTVNTKALYQAKKDDKTSTQSGGSQGDRTGKGDMGSSEGKPQGKGILGGGMGSWELSGRSLVKGTTIEDTKEEGTVVLNIWVDQFGNVTRSTPNLAESTTTSQYLFDLAARAAKRSKYSAKSNAAVEQKGKMTFKFILE